MYSETEITIFLESSEVKQLVSGARKEFIALEARCMDISLHDFLALVLITPSLGVALANNNVSLLEELALNRMARRMSKGDYFLKQDPVVHAMGFLIRHFDDWEDRFLNIIRLILNIHLDEEYIKSLEPVEHKNELVKLAGRSPLFIANFLSCFLLHDDLLMGSRKSVSKIEYRKIVSLGTRLNINHLPVFTSFLDTFKVK